MYIDGQNSDNFIAVGDRKMSRVALIGENSVEYVDKLLDKAVML